MAGTERGELGHSVIAWSRACVAISVMLTAAVCMGSTVAMWDGCCSKFLTYDQCVTELRGKNPQAAAERLRVKVQFGLRELREMSKRPGRDGRVARNALEHIRKELDR